MDRSLGIVIPAYRPDVARLSTYVQAIDAGLDVAALRIELDAPGPGVVEALNDLPATVHAVPRRRGKGAAVTHGFERLDTDVHAFVDADGSIPPESVAAVIAPVVEGRAALAVGSRRHPEATIRAHQTHARRWLGDAFAWLARRVLEPQLYDYQCGAKAIDRAAWTDVRRHLYEPGFAWDVELIAMTAARGHPIVEVPVVWDDQPGSTVSTLGTSLDLAQTLFAARRRARHLREDPSHSTSIADHTGREALVDRPGPNND